MKKIVIAALALAAVSAWAQTHVNGYYRSNGTYVAPHYRSSPDSTTLNNYSTQGNYNPYTGATGHTDPYRAPSYGSTYSAPSYGSSNSLGGGATTLGTPTCPLGRVGC